MVLFPISRESQAYQDGSKSGHADAIIGHRSEYVYFTQPNDPNVYTREYAKGYRDSYRETRRGC